MTKHVIIVDNAVATQQALTRALDRDDAADGARVAGHHDAELSSATAVELVLLDLDEHHCGSAGRPQSFEREHLQEIIGPLLP